MEKVTVLFVCVHNSARSQIAEALLKNIGGDIFQVESAGIEPGELNPLAVEIMKEENIDISSNKTKSVFEFYRQGKLFNYVIAVCDEVSAQQCPIFPGFSVRLNWSLEDPASFTGTYEERLEKIRTIKDRIKAYVIEFIDMVKCKTE